MSPICTVMKVAIHQPGINPVYGDGVIYIEVVDEAGGAFIELSQGENRVQIDPTELDLVVAKAKELLENFPE